MLGTRRRARSRLFVPVVVKTVVRALAEPVILPARGNRGGNHFRGLSTVTVRNVFMLATEHVNQSRKIQRPFSRLHPSAFITRLMVGALTLTPCLWRHLSRCSSRVASGFAPSCLCNSETGGPDPQALILAAAASLAAGAALALRARR